MNNLVSPNEADIINKDEKHRRNHNHQKAANFIESDNDINPAKLMVAEITMEKGDHDTSKNQIQWDIVEVWETKANSNDEYPNTLVEQGIDVLTDIWLDVNDINEGLEIETYWDAKSCSEDEIMNCKSNQKKNFFGTVCQA